MEYLIFNIFARLLSFSINVSDFGFFFIISSVKAPFPGPISIILLFFDF